MKKFFNLSIALLSIVFFCACSSKDGVSSKAEGTYMTHRVTDMVNLPPMYPFTPLQENVKVQISASADDYINVVLPSTTYQFGGQPMTIPQFTIHNIPVLDAGDEGVFVPKHNFLEKVDNKTVQGTIEIDVEPDGDLEMEVAFTYGSMPFAIKQEFESLD